MTPLTIRTALVCLIALGSSAQAQTYFVANLTGAQEVPANASTATGFGRVTLNAAQTQITVSVYYSGLGSNLTAGHVHGPSAVGANGPVIFNLAPTTGVTSGSVVGATFNVTSTQAANLAAGLHYINIHSSGFPGGEIRGQLVPTVPQPATLTGAQEVPPVASGATGTAVVSTNSATNQALISVQWSGLSGNATAGHIHQGAFGVNGPLNCNLSPTAAANGSIVDALCSYSAAQITELRNGQYYVNIHTSANPGGEIRGQIIDLLFRNGFQ
ncbi:MAG: CHRD domain-containing protein [Rhodanobacteraceae bacterium]|nr:CHRD domain-containing protein [Rhodanobacteraceae bacterium]